MSIAGFWLYDFIGLHSKDNIIEGNFIGTDSTGTVAVPNASEGILLHQQAENTLIGGYTSASCTAMSCPSRNIISGNSREGITVWSDFGRTRIQYNWIGLNVNGAPLGNGYPLSSDGRGRAGILAGGATTIAYNRIAYNSANGIEVWRQYVDYYANSIFSNRRLGIGFDGWGTPWPNDLGDADKGPYGLQNHPIVTTALSEPTQLKISGTFRPDDREDATGGGTWTTATGNGTYKVIELVSWHLAPGVLNCPNDPTPGQRAAGLAVLRIKYNDGSKGVLTISCRLAGTPLSVFEGIAASKGFIDYTHNVEPVLGVNANPTLFHIQQEEDDGDDDDN